MHSSIVAKGTAVDIRDQFLWRSRGDWRRLGRSLVAVLALPASPTQPRKIRVAGARSGGREFLWPIENLTHSSGFWPFKTLTKLRLKPTSKSIVLTCSAAARDRHRFEAQLR